MHDEAVLVKPAQTRGQGYSKVYRCPGTDWPELATGSFVYIKTQSEYTCRPIWRACRRTPTLQRELRALLACRKIGLNVPEVIGYQQEGLAAELVISEIADALTLQEALASADADRQQILSNAGHIIGRMHAHGWTHGALNQDHILIQPLADNRAALIDFEKARRSRRLIKADLERFWRRNNYLSSADRTTFEKAYKSVNRGQSYPE